MYTVEQLDNLYIIHPVHTTQRRFDPRKRSRLFREIIVVVALAVLISVGIRATVQNFLVDGMSMEPSLHNQETVLIDKLTYGHQLITRGDIIVFNTPPAAHHPGEVFIKRVIGLPGDTITIENGIPIVNGASFKEFYVDPKNSGATTEDQAINNIVIPPNSYFVMGDNRRASFDSRAWGFVPRANILGKAIFVYWPLFQDNNGPVPNVSSVFAQVPRPLTAP